MATYQLFGNLTVNMEVSSGTDLTNQNYRLVKLDSNAKPVLATADTDEVVGVIYASDYGDKAVALCAVPGAIVKLVLGGTVNAGDKLTAGAGGAAVAWTAPGAGSTNHYCAVALEGGASGETISALFVGDHSVSG